MTSPCLRMLEDGVADLSLLIRSFELEENLLGLSLDQDSSSAGLLIKEIKLVYGNTTRKKEFNYNAIIVTLYGLLERFVEDLIEYYIDQLSNMIKSYTDLPSDFRIKHSRLSAELLTRIEQQRYQGLISARDVIKNLHSCFESEVYSLNVHAFTYHSSNIRHDSISQLMEAIGVEAIAMRAKHDERFCDFLRASAFPEMNNERIAKLEDKIIFATLNELADRRNDVAHGVRGDILAPALLRSFLEYVREYCNVLFRIVTTGLLPYQIKYSAIPLGSPIEVYANHIVCCELKNIKIRVGDKLIAKTKHSLHPFLVSHILEIQIDNVSHSEVRSQDSVKVGMRVDFHAKVNHELFLIPAS